MFFSRMKHSLPGHWPTATPSSHSRLCSFATFAMTASHSEPNVVKLFTPVIYTFLSKARVLVPCKPFQPSLILRIRLEPTLMKNLLGAPFQDKLLALPRNIRIGWRGLSRTNTLAYCKKFIIDGLKKFYNICPWLTIQNLPKTRFGFQALLSGTYIVSNSI